jgi:hypothetical protein
LIKFVKLYQKERGFKVSLFVKEGDLEGVLSFGNSYIKTNLSVCFASTSPERRGFFAPKALP